MIRTVRSIVPATLGVLCLAPVARGAGPLLAFVQAPTSATRPAGIDIGDTILAGRYVLGMRIVTADFDGIARTMRVVTEGFACATDPVLSYDGTRLAFSGMRTRGDHLQIWEIVGDEPQPRRIVTCDADCVSPVYLPNGHIVFASLLSREYEEHGGKLSFSLYECASAGVAPVRLTFNPSSEFDPVVLPDGRLVFSSWQHVGNHHWPRGVVALMLVNADGTGVFPLTGNHRGPWLKRGAQPFGEPGRTDRVAFIRSERFSDFGAGALVRTSLNDAFAPYATLIPADRYRVSDVSPLPEGALLLSARPSDSAGATFGLYGYKGKDISLLYDDPNHDDLAPAVWDRLSSRSKDRPESLSHIPGASRPEIRVSTVVPGTPYGYLAVLNCYDTDRTDQHRLRDGSIKLVRVIEGRPIRREGRSGPEFFSVPGREDEPLIHPSSATGYVPARILGEVPPAADGSVYLKVPADRPLRIQLVDREGFTIIGERAWFWVRPNERRVCIGCHENRELAPLNKAPLAARRVPTDLTDPSGWQTVTFRKDIAPIVTASCAVTDCHIPPTPTAGLNQAAQRLSDGKDAVLADRFGPAYANLLDRQENKPFSVGGRRVHPGDARSSPMLWMLYGRALARQYQPAPFERPLISAHPGPMLPEAALELIRKWVDLGAAYDEPSPPGPWPYTIPPADAREAPQ